MKIESIRLIRHDDKESPGGEKYDLVFLEINTDSSDDKYSTFGVEMAFTKGTDELPHLLDAFELIAKSKRKILEKSPT